MTEANPSERLTATFPHPSEQTDTERLALAIAQAADGRKADNIVLLHLRGISYLADFFAIATGHSRAQVRAIAEAIQERVEAELGQKPVRVEGMDDRSWVLLDYGDAIAHIMLPEEREFYDIEAFWGHAERFEFADLPLPARQQA